MKVLANRSVSLRSCIELWADEKDSNSLHNTLKNIPKEFFSSHFEPKKSFKIEVETFCRHITQKEKIKKIEVRWEYFKSVRVIFVVVVGI